MFRPAIILTIALATLTVLGGCANTMAPKKPELSLMERFNSGMDLMADEDVSTPEAKKQAARAHLMRGLNFHDLGRTELAFEQYSRAAALDPDLAEARYRRGLTLMERGMSGEALAEFTAVQERIPDFAPAHEAAGLVYFENSLYQEAEQHLAKAISLDPKLARSFVHIGVIRNYRSDHEGALKAFEAALAINPNDGAVHNNMGMTLSMLGRDEDAVQAFGAALRMGAPTARAYNNMGLALARLGRWREALEAFRCAGGEAAAYNNLGYLYFLEEEYAKAVSAFEKAIDLEPRYYVRASENLKRARLALQFAESGKARPVPAGGAGIPLLDQPTGVPYGPLTPAGGAPGPELAPAHETSAPEIPTRPRTAAPFIPMRSVSMDEGEDNTAPAQPVEEGLHETEAKATGVSHTPNPVSKTPIAASHATASTRTASTRTASVVHFNNAGFVPTDAAAALSPFAAITPAAALSPASLTTSVAAPPTTTVAQTATSGWTVAATPAKHVAKRYDPGPLPNYPVYTLHQSSWHSLGRAQQVAARLQNKGHEAYVLHVRLPEKGDWYRVTIGMFVELDDARARLAQLKGHKGMEDLRVVRRQLHRHPGS